MRSIGMLLIFVGLLCTFIAFQMSTTVSSYDGSGTYNLGLLQQQMMALQTGLGAFIAGTILFAASAIVEVNSAGTSAARTTSGLPTEHGQEREEQLAGVRRLNRIIGFALLAGLVILALVTRLRT